MEKSAIYASLFLQSGAPRGLTVFEFRSIGEGAELLMANYDAFLALSVELTAFKRVELQGTGQGELYFATLVRIVGPEMFEMLIGRYAEIVEQAAGNPEALQVAMRRRILGDQQLGPIARNLIKLWFCGIWYQLPIAWSQAYGPRPGDVTCMISPNAYVEGLMWTTIGAHPAGAKAQGYASWANPPRIPAVPG